MQDATVKHFLGALEPASEDALQQPEQDLRKTFAAIRHCWHNAGVVIRLTQCCPSTSEAAIYVHEARREAMNVRILAFQSSLELLLTWFMDEPMVYTVVLRDAYKGMAACLTLLCIGEAREMVQALSGVLYA